MSDERPPQGPTPWATRYTPPPYERPSLTPEQEALIVRRQRGRALVMGLLLGGLVLLIFLVTIAKIKAGMK